MEGMTPERGSASCAPVSAGGRVEFLEFSENGVEMRRAWLMRIVPAGLIAAGIALAADQPSPTAVWAAKAVSQYNTDAADVVYLTANNFECPNGTLPKVAAIVDFYGITDVNDLLDGPNKKSYAVPWIGSRADRCGCEAHVAADVRAARASSDYDDSGRRRSDCAVLTLHAPQRGAGEGGRGASACHGSGPQARQFHRG